MKRPGVVRVWSPDFNDVSAIDDVGDCFVLVTFELGDSAGADCFTFHVATLAWVSRNMPLWGMTGLFRHPLLIVEKFDWDVLDAAVEERIDGAAADADDWSEFARTFGGWEYLNRDTDGP